MICTIPLFVHSRPVGHDLLQLFDAPLIVAVEVVVDASLRAGISSRRWPRGHIRVSKNDFELDGKKRTLAPSTVHVDNKNSKPKPWKRELEVGEIGSTIKFIKKPLDSTQTDSDKTTTVAFPEIYVQLVLEEYSRSTFSFFRCHLIVKPVVKSSYTRSFSGIRSPCKTYPKGSRRSSRWWSA